MRKRARLVRNMARRLARSPGVTVLIALGLLTASLALGIRNEHVGREDRARQALVQARILAGSVAAALAFDDRATAQEYVNAQRANPEIEAVGVYGPNGHLVAGFAQPDQQVPQINRLGRPQFDRGDLAVTAPVTQAGMKLGSVYMRAALEPWTRRASRYVGIAIIVVMASLLIIVLGASYASATEANRQLQEEMAARREAEDALRQSQKMEAMGQLTGGVAHDFNNLLMAASSGLELLGRTDDPARIDRLRQGIRQALDRGAKLTQQLLTFARRSPLKPEVIDLGRRIHGLGDLLDRSLRENIHVDIAIPPGVWPVEVDPSQFDVALLNIAVNARDAMPSGGTITIAARNLPATGEAEDRVALDIHDQGAGMPPDLIDKVFEPFFTTKGVGQGTGLGLSQVYGFVRGAGGNVEIESAPGQGTTVRLLFPRSAATVADVAAPPLVDESAAPPRGHVLLAEDDEQVADLVQQMLEELGYRVRRYATAATALDAFNGPVPVDVVLSDMMMPGDMGGLELAQAVRRRRQSFPVVLMTGYSAAARAVGEEGIELLTKPFTIDALSTALERALRR